MISQIPKPLKIVVTALDSVAQLVGALPPN